MISAAIECRLVDDVSKPLLLQIIRGARDLAVLGRSIQI